MKKRIFLFVLNFIIMSLLYRADYTVAMAAQQNAEEPACVPVTVPEAGKGGQPTAGPGAEEGDKPTAGPETEEDDKPTAGSESEEGDKPTAGPESEKGGQPTAGPGAEEGDKPAAGPESEEGNKPTADPESEKGGQPWAGPESEEGNKPTADPESEKGGQPWAGPESEEGNKPTADPESEKGGQPAAGPETESGDVSADDSPEPTESVSTGPELIEWLEAHKYTGGKVKLTDDIVWDEAYIFCPNGINMPSIHVDAGGYTVTVTGQIELLGDHHLSFSGQPDGKSLFQVAGNGLLSMQGVAVESGDWALWQEEGAGLVVSDCHISGSVHYADTPYVIYYRDNVCAVVEKGQTINEALPSQVNCRVNRQGRLCNEERVPVLWNLEGTEKQQEERQRFRLQGSFLDVASAEPVSCTVVYNDYPLTFTDVIATARGCLYTFQGGFTIREEYLPFTVKAEYSFDGVNWLLFEEQRVKCADAAFYIACKDERKVRESASNIYIRLQHEADGTKYFSNVLRYTADNMDDEEDIGGSRGGGTSITNPPDEPQDEVEGAPSDEEDQKEPGNDADSENVGPEIPPATDQEESVDRDPEEASPGSGTSGKPSSRVNASGNNEDQPLQAEPSDSKADQPSTAAVSKTGEDQPLQAESPDTGADHTKEAELTNNQTGAPSEKPIEQPLFAEVGDTQSAGQSVPAAAGNEAAVEAISAYGGNFIQTDEHARAAGRQVYYMAIATGFVLLSVIAGIAGFYARSHYSRSGTKR